MAARWLVKSEPDVFGWAHQVKAGIEPWTGVRNHLARNNLRAMQEGDLAFFYHSNIGKEIVGVVRVVRTAYPDPTVKQDDRKGDWVCVDMQAVGPFPTPVTLAAIKAEPKLAGMALLTSARLSVQPVTAAQWRHICRMGGYRQ
jgi:predicted RNA-binding protein with PUA-like domain